MSYLLHQALAWLCYSNSSTCGDARLQKKKHLKNIWRLPWNSSGEKYPKHQTPGWLPKLQQETSTLGRAGMERERQSWSGTSIVSPCITPAMPFGSTHIASPCIFEMPFFFFKLWSLIHELFRITQYFNNNNWLIQTLRSQVNEQFQEKPWNEPYLVPSIRKNAGAFGFRINT